jgi:hypothetical protein
MATGKGNSFINSFLNLILNATTMTSMAQNASSSPYTSLYWALHTANPGATGNQTTSEAAYTSYARVAAARTTSGFSAATAQVSNPASTVVFPTATGGSETETYCSLGTASSGAGIILWFGPISPSIAVVNGTTPELTTGTSITES